MFKLFKPQIKRLKFIIKHWEDFKFKPEKTAKLFRDTFKGDCISIENGLCDNAFLNDLLIEEDKNKELIKEMFEAFPKYSGSLFYPLGNFENYSEMENFTETPERLELAKHCVKFLKKERKKNKYKIEVTENVNT